MAGGRFVLGVLGVGLLGSCQGHRPPERPLPVWSELECRLERDPELVEEHGERFWEIVGECNHFEKTDRECSALDELLPLLDSEPLPEMTRKERRFSRAPYIFGDRVDDDFGEYVSLAGEGLLIPPPRGASYRLVWVSSVHDPVVVRLDCGPRRCRIVGKRLTVGGGFGPTVLCERMERQLGEEESSTLRACLEDEALWAPPPAVDCASEEPTAARFVFCDETLGGEAWLFERKEGDEYRVRFVENEDGEEVRRFRDLLLDASGLDWRR